VQYLCLGSVGEDEEWLGSWDRADLPSGFGRALLRDLLLEDTKAMIVFSLTSLSSHRYVSASVK
jgi:hypothetical protein